MSLPSVLEIVPLRAPVDALIAIPGSKSITNRALLLSALADAPVTLQGALWSDDTEVMADCLERLGIGVAVAGDPLESDNRVLRIAGGGRLTPGGSAENPLELFVGNAGSAARFVAALACLGAGHYRLSGTPRMHERPQGALFAALRGLGYRVTSPNDRLPAVIEGAGPRPGAHCRVRIEESSQFASALLLAATRGGWRVTVEGEDADASPYVALTADVIGAFPAKGGEFVVEPDASGASYFWGAAWLLPSSIIRVARWMAASSQIDARFPDVLRTFPATVSRRRDLGDAIMTAIVLAPLSGGEKTFTDLGRLRVQECERVRALRTELAKCGARVAEEGDTLRIAPGPLHGAEIETYDDHRMAMCFAMLGLVVPGIRIRNPGCVRKTFPDFFGKLSAAPPNGLGVGLRG
jgi:3-phosphoshikimate 1-carboxyvinyltransferase